ncbi:hypothetical protein FXO38_03491, partial [Capsicum annuum]
LLADVKRVVVGGEGEDRISELPANVLDRILELLPVKDAAKPSILSKNWRYNWAMLSNSQLDKAFCYKLAVKSRSVFNSLTTSWSHYEVVDNPNREHDERSTLEKLLLSVAATLEFLLMGLGYFELLTADTIPKGPPFTRLQELSLGIDFGNLSQTTCALQLIKSCPNLSKLQIWGCASRDSAEAVLKYLKRPITCLDLRLNELKYVGISSHECSKTELLFVKLLFACTPSLVRMCYEQQKPFDSSDERKLTRKLMCFSRAFPSIFRIRRLRTTTCVAYIMV